MSDGLDPSGMWLREWALPSQRPTALTLDLPIAPADIAAATLARHRRMAIASGADAAVVDAPAYRATLARAVPVAVAPYITGQR